MGLPFPNLPFYDDNQCLRFQKEVYPDYEPATTSTLCQRWRQENYFRYSKHQQQLDYIPIPSYKTRERQKQRMIKNPFCKELEKERNQPRKEIDKLNQHMAQKLTGRKKKDMPLEQVLQQKDIQKLTMKKEKTEAKTKMVEERLAVLGRNG